MNSAAAGIELTNYIFHLADSVVEVSMEVAEAITSTDVTFNQAAFVAAAVARFEIVLTDYINGPGY